MIIFDQEYLYFDTGNQFVYFVHPWLLAMQTNMNTF